MIIERTFDYDLVDSILTHPEIYKTIADDFAPPANEFKTPRSEEIIYLIDDQAIGVMVYSPASQIVMDCHVQVLPEHRKERALAFGKAVIEWLWRETGFKKINAQIPFLYPNVREFAERNGFVVEGINRGSYLKNGELYDKWYLGLVR